MKPITITRTGNRAYAVSVNGYPVGRDDAGKLTFNRAAAGKAPTAEPTRKASFTSKVEAESIAHTIGRYLLGLGSFVSTYVEFVDARTGVAS